MSVKVFLVKKRLFIRVFPYKGYSESAINKTWGGYRPLKVIKYQIWKKFIFTMSVLKNNEENKQKKTRKRKKKIRGIRREEKGTWVFYKKKPRNKNSIQKGGREI